MAGEMTPEMLDVVEASIPREIVAALRAAWAERDAAAAEADALRRALGGHTGRPAIAQTYEQNAGGLCLRHDSPRPSGGAVRPRPPRTHHAEIAEARREVIAAERAIAALELGHTPDAWEAAIARRKAAYARLDALEEGGA